MQIRTKCHQRKLHLFSGTIHKQKTKKSNKKHAKLTKKSQLTHILRNQNRASCRNTFSGFIRNTSIIITSASGFTNGGMLKLALYIKLNMLRAQTTPNMAASSIKCCSDRWFLGSSSNINTWLTPEDLQPYTLMPMRNMNSTKRKGPRYRRNAVLRLSEPPSWNKAGKKERFVDD